MLGAVIDFPSLELIYVVGSGWFTQEGEPVQKRAAYARIRRTFRVDIG